jgi:taurine--2-oxoglutarate transaminase
MHVVPPCNITEAEFNEGLAILDKAFSAIGKHYTGSAK